MARRLNTIILYSHPGYGKTISAAMALPNALWVLTRESNLDGYDDYLLKEPAKAKEMGLKPISRKVEVPTNEIDPATGGLIPVSTMDYLSDILASYCKHVSTGSAEGIDGIVLDEFSVFAKQVYEELSQTNRNGFDVIRKFKAWISSVLAIAQVTKKPMILLCHAKDPTYYDDGPKQGQVKYKGGPAMPIGTVIGEVCALPDAVLQMEVIPEDITQPDKVRRVFKTQAHPLWERKCRLWGLPPVIEADLRGLLKEQAGW